MAKSSRIKKNVNRAKYAGRWSGSPNPMTKMQAQLAQHTGMRVKDPLKVTLVKAPWDDDEQMEKNDREGP